MRLSSSFLSLPRFLLGTALVISLCPKTSYSQRKIGCYAWHNWRTFVHESRTDCEARIPISVCSGTCYSETSYVYEMVPFMGIPMAKQRCKCCRPSKYRISSTRVNFKCRNGDTIRQKVWFPKDLECSCDFCKKRRGGEEKSWLYTEGRTVLET